MQIWSIRLAALSSFVAIVSGVQADEISLTFETLSDGFTPSIEYQELTNEYANVCVVFRNLDATDSSKSAEFRRFVSTNTVVWDNDRIFNPPPGTSFNILAEFLVPVSQISADATVPVGHTLTMTAYDSFGTTLGSDVSIISPSCCSSAIDTLTLSGIGEISKVLWETSAPRAGIPVIDNLNYTTVIPCRQEAQIDIKPSSHSNAVRPTSNGVLPVTVLTTSIAGGDSADFDATQLDQSTIRFGPAGARITHKTGHLEDIDRDGDTDLMLHFRIRDTGIICGDRAAELSGQTNAGQTVFAVDAIRTVGCK